MWRWFSSEKDGFPPYSLLEREPRRAHPEDLDAQEKSDEYKLRYKRLGSELCAQVTDENTPRFFHFLKEKGQQLQVLTPEFNGGCLLAFSSALRAADYARVRVPEKKFDHAYSSPAQAAFGITELRKKVGTSHIVLDECPRCNIFTPVDTSNWTSADLIRVWKLAKAIEMTRCNLYLAYARVVAATGKFLKARNVLLELVGHVTA